MGFFKRLLAKPTVAAAAGPAPVKRVIRKGEVFVCGMCRKEFPDMPSANDCLSACSSNFLKAKPVFVYKQGDATRYRCRICGRDYEMEAQAKICAAACSQLAEKSHADEQKVAEMSVSARRRVTRTVPTKAQPRRPLKPPPKKIAAPVVPVVPPLPDLAMDNILANEVPLECEIPLEPVQPERQKDSDIFFRDGARYVCKSCKSKFFTKDEVVACYDKHMAPPSPDGASVPPASDPKVS